jgi:hypothetical protein
MMNGNAKLLYLSISQAPSKALCDTITDACGLLLAKKPTKIGSKTDDDKC